MKTFLITKNGKLLKKTWDHKTQSDIVTDVTKDSIRYLFEECEIDKGVTLKDVFLLIKQDLKRFDLFLGNWCKEIVEEGLRPYHNPTVSEIAKKGKNEFHADDEVIDFLELYWAIYPETEENEPVTLTGVSFPAFHGIGTAKAGNSSGHKVGDTIKYAIDFSESNSLTHLPIVLKNKVEVYNDFNSVVGMKDFKLQYTLGQILYGIIWELSYHGSPKSRKSVGDSLKNALLEIKSTLSDDE